MSSPLPPHLRARAHHYIFAHLVLRNEAFASTAELPTYGAMALVGMAMTGKLEGHLVQRWTDLGRALAPDDQPIPAEGIDAELLDLTDHHAALITLPPVQRPTEAYHVLIAQHRAVSRMRYLTFECSMETIDGNPAVVVGEWLGTGGPPQRRNHGAIPSPDRHTVVAAAERALAAG